MFMTFEEAKNAHNIDDNTMCIKVVEHKRSLERFDQDGRVLRIMGPGRLLSPGHPSGNHMYHNLNPFFKKASSQMFFPVFVKHTNGKVTYKGTYSYNSVKKTICEEGFTYFEIKLYKRYS